VVEDTEDEEVDRGVITEEVVTEGVVEEAVVVAEAGEEVVENLVYGKHWHRTALPPHEMIPCHLIQRQMETQQTVALQY
jgi:hypothetical protein